ncbi:MAG: DUF3782 domain-containing protein, partial [Thermoprotei archaeon]
EFQKYMEETNKRFETQRLEFQKYMEETNKRFETQRLEFQKYMEETNKRFEAADKRFEAIDKRFEYVIAELRDLRLEVSALGGRLGRGFEEIVRQTIRTMAGVEVTEVRRLVLKDDEGEVYGWPSEVEFDAYASNGEKFLLEVKSHAKKGDVYNFARKAQWAEKKLGKTNKILVAAFIDSTAYRECQKLGIMVVTRNIVPEEQE